MGQKTYLAKFSKRGNIQRSKLKAAKDKKYGRSRKISYGGSFIARLKAIRKILACEKSLAGSVVLLPHKAERCTFEKSSYFNALQVLSVHAALDIKFKLGKLEYHK